MHLIAIAAYFFSNTSFFLFFFLTSPELDEPADASFHLYTQFEARRSSLYDICGVKKELFSIWYLPTAS